MSEVPEIHVSVSPEHIDSLWKAPRSYVSVTVLIGTNRLEEVGLHLKGGYGSSSPLKLNPSLTLRFDRFRRDRFFHGLSKIHLNNSFQDGTWLSEFTSSEVFRAAGVPSPKVDHAIVWLNERLLGIYVVKEGVDERFLERELGESKGNLYQGDLGEDLNPKLHRTEGHGSDEALQRFVETLALKPGKEKESRLDPSMASFYSYAAAEIFVGHNDGYCLGSHNYRVSVGRDRFAFIPHGMDMTFGDPGTPIMPSHGASVMRAVLESPYLRAGYRKTFREWVHGAFPLDRIEDRIRITAERLERAIQKVAPERLESFQAGTRQRVRNLESRLRSVREQLPLHPSETKPSRRGSTTVFEIQAEAWRPSTDFGKCELARATNNAGSEVLTIAVGRAQTSNQARWEACVQPSTEARQLVVEVEERFSSQEHQRTPPTLWIEAGAGTRREIQLRNAVKTQTLRTQLVPSGKEQELVLGYHGQIGQAAFKVWIE
ncbi:MAG: CotH kinase family protein [Verrucomicrobia bacterium]|nr:CotH kinase family protein [Verrucomicrobiota bacterium]